MLVLRCTQKHLRNLRRSADPDPGVIDTTTLGEWYSNLIAIGRRKQVLFVNASTFLAVVVDPAPLDGLMESFRARLRLVLRHLGVPDDRIDRELRETQAVSLARTASRSVTATMNQIAFEIQAARSPSEFPSRDRDIDLEMWLAGMIRTALGDDIPATAAGRRFGSDPERNRRGDRGAISVERRGRREWEFVFGRLEGSVMQTLHSALDIMDDGHYTQAQHELLRLARDYPEFIDIHHHLAIIYSDKGNHARALELWERAVDIGLRALPRAFRMGRDRLPWGFLDNRPFLRAYHGLGLERRRRGDTESAAEIFRNLIALNPDDHQGARALLVDAYLRLDDNDGVLSVCRDHADTEMPDLLYGRVLAALRAGPLAEAYAALAIAVDRRPLVAQELVRRRHTLPKGMHPHYFTRGGADEAYHYWQEAGDLWTATEDAIAFVVDFLNELDPTAHNESRPDNVIPLRRSATDRPTNPEFPTDERASAAARRLTDIMHDMFPHVPDLVAQMDTEALVRLRPLNDAFTSAREARGLSIKQVSALIKAPQYRLRDIEGASSRPFDHKTFCKYRDFLGLNEFTARWIAANRNLALRLGIE